MFFQIITLFPELFPGPLGVSVMGRALSRGLWGLRTVNPRDFGFGPHKKVDDASYGGGAGMVLRPDVIAKAVEHMEPAPEAFIYMSPRGRPMSSSLAKYYGDTHKNIAILCGRFEGVDQRVLDHFNFQEISMGDYILSGGEVPAMGLMDSILRFLPGVLGNRLSHGEESFSDGLLEYPHYTKPALWEGKAVPSVLCSGDHGKVAKWRFDQSKELTQRQRPDLWEKWENPEN